MTHAFRLPPVRAVATFWKVTLAARLRMLRRLKDAPDATVGATSARSSFIGSDQGLAV